MVNSKTFTDYRRQFAARPYKQKIIIITENNHCRQFAAKRRYSGLYLKRFSIIVLVIFIISVISGTALSVSKAEIPLELVTETIYADDGSVYLLEQSGNNCNIFHTDKKGNIIESILNEKISGNNYYRLFNMKYFKGSLYVILYRNNVVDTTDYNNSIYKCDFKRKKLEKILDLDEIQILDYTADDDWIYMLYIDENYSVQKKALNQKFSESSESVVYDENYVVCTKILSDIYGNTYVLTTDFQFMGFTSDNQQYNIYPDGKVSEISYDGDNRIYFTNCSDETIMYYDISTQSCNTVDIDYRISDLKGFCFTDDGKFSCSADNMKGGYSLAVYDGNSIITTDRIYSGYTVLKAVVFTILIFIVLSLCAVLVYVFIFRYIPLVIRMITVFAVVSCISAAVIFTGMKSCLDSSFNDFLDDKLIYMSENRVKQLYGYSQDDIKQLLETDLTMIDYNEMNDIQQTVYNVISYFENKTIVEVDDTLGFEDDININYSYFYSIYAENENNDIVTIFNSDYNCNILTRYLKNSYVENTVRNVFETGNNNIVTDLYLMQECTSAYVPVYSADGNISAVAEISMINNKESLSRVNEIINSNIYMIVLVMIIMIVLIAVFLVIFLKPLKELKNKASELMQGNMGVKVKIHGNNEISKLSEQFNRISSELADNISDMKLLAKYYEYYVPEKLFRLLKKNNISDISNGDEEIVSLAVLRINVHTENNEPETINRITAEISDISEEYGGIIEHYGRHEIKILFTEKYHNAVRTAMAVSELDDISARSYVSFEKCRVKVLGSEKRFSIASDSRNYGHFIKGCNIIVTDSIINKCDDFFRTFNTRFIGIENHIKLFEVFSGGSMKRIYKDKFETAVKLFMMKKYRDARNIFIEIFENYPKDSLAGNYIYLCDDMLKGESDI